MPQTSATLERVTLPTRRQAVVTEPPLHDDRACQQPETSATTGATAGQIGRASARREVIRERRAVIIRQVRISKGFVTLFRTAAAARPMNYLAETLWPGRRDSGMDRQ